MFLPFLHVLGKKSLDWEALDNGCGAHAVHASLRRFGGLGGAIGDNWIYLEDTKDTG